MNVLWSPTAKYCQSKVLKYSTPPPEYFNICSWNWSDEPISQVDREGGLPPNLAASKLLLLSYWLTFAAISGGWWRGRRGKGSFLFSVRYFNYYFNFPQPAFYWVRLNKNVKKKILKNTLVLQMSLSTHFSAFRLENSKLLVHLK